MIVPLKLQYFRVYFTNSVLKRMTCGFFFLYAFTYSVFRFHSVHLSVFLLRNLCKPVSKYKVPMSYNVPTMTTLIYVFYLPWNHIARRVSVSSQHTILSRLYHGRHRRDNTGHTLHNIRLMENVHRHRTIGDQVADYTGFVTSHHNKRDSVLQTTQSGRWY